jgi:hypothetical protein
MQNIQFVSPCVNGNSRCNTFSNINQKKILDTYKNKQYLRNNVSNPYIHIPNVCIDNTHSISKTDKIYTKDKDTSKDTAPYDPYLQYLFKNGLLNSNYFSNYVVHYLNIDSTYRNKDPSIMNISTVTLPNNPLLFTYGSSLLYIQHHLHTFVANDRIVLSNIQPKIVKVCTTGTLHIDSIQSDGTFVTNTIENRSILDFTNNSPYVKINYTHFLYVQNSTDTFYDTFDISNLYVEFKDIRSNLSDITTGSYLDNIPLNILNKRHNIILQDPVTKVIYRNAFFIKLLKSYIPINGIGYTPPKQPYTFRIFFHYICGVPLNVLNTGYPITNKNLKGYHTISNVVKDGYYINTGSISTGLINKLTYEISSTYIGGSQISVSNIANINIGYPYPNQYTLALDKLLTNVIAIKMVSSEFPNTASLIYSATKKNNKLYWQNLDDGEHIYSIAITPGNYNLTELKTILEAAFYAVPRIYYTRDNVLTTYSNKITPPYTNHNYIKFDVNISTSQITFTCYREIFLYKPFITIIPEISQDPTVDLDESIMYTLVVNHPNHGLLVGDRILVSGSLDVMGISANIINTEQIISAIIDTDTYQFILPRTNLNIQRNDTKGGVAIGIYTPNMFCLRFDFSDTMGSILGFRNVGDINSITDFNTSITNTDQYINDASLDAYGNPVVFVNNSLNFSGVNYILVVCNNIITMTNCGPVKNVFAKILITDLPGNIMFNSFVPLCSMLTSPISQLFELSFEFYNPDGTLYNFNGIDHSFTLEIITLHNVPVDTKINTQTGLLT